MCVHVHVCLREVCEVLECVCVFVFGATYSVVWLALLDHPVSAEGEERGPLGM